MSDTAQQIKDRLDIADFIRGYIQLSPAGKGLKGLCPFHKEKTPSFIVSPDRQIWHCFGCNIGGDAIAFLMRYENIEFFEALKILGEKTGVDVAKSGGPDQRQLHDLYEANRAAKDFFKRSLRESATAIDYLKSRGLKPETAAEFEIGFAPDLPDALSRELLKTGFATALLERAGLILKTDRGTYRDRFRNRVMFPIANHFGKIVGFTGRIMPGFEAENIGKYVNSPETPIFNKSKILYGLDKSKNAIRDARSAVLVEGQMDFLMAWQDGIKNLVATSGTALTLDHLKNLKRVAENLILSFDEDAAGQAATERAIDLASSLDLAVKVLRLPKELSAKDPADVVLANPGILKTFAETAKPAMEYYLDKYQLKGGDIANIKRNARLVLSKIRLMDSAIDRDHWLKEVVRLTGISESNLMEEMEKGKPTEKLAKEDVAVSESKTELPASRKDAISQRIISLVLNDRNLYVDLEPNLNLLPENYRELAAHYFKDSSPALSGALEPLADLISLRSGLEFNPDPLKNKKELLELVRQLRLGEIAEELQSLHSKIEERERSGGDVIELLTQKQKLAEERRQLELDKGKVA